MEESTTTVIYVIPEIKAELDRMKIIEEEPYHKVIKRLLESYKKYHKD